jgi:hypothetical protein
MANIGVITGEDTIVSGETIAQWTADWWRSALQAKAGAGPLDNPQDAAWTINGDIYFISGGSGGGYQTTITVPEGTTILLPMINSFDTEGPGIETLPDMHFSSYVDEARYVTELFQGNIKSAYATLSQDNKTLLNIQLGGSAASDQSKYAVESPIFAIGKPEGDSYIKKLLQGVPLAPSIKDLPYTASSGDWVMLSGLKAGTYTLDFGGTEGKTAVNPNGFMTASHDTLIVTPSS